ncbi:transcriptional regulator, TetR family [Actinacidiphila yanglinensis]|uniref:Transcriptional regulator, TetR family n=1 Tax=Actinacidiphila yanglinensis TaxID=310779 RepID=A0A1H6CP11_9ACTN|nr:TetR/AcrR family transcriptional regulator [Actinacidiphila yanglinensis]SEG74681.1 transcriptional regulator, TetR family [Actinacidiphila yanglinensis]
MTTQAGTGRSNQKQRTRTAIMTAARDLIGSGREVTMPEIARRSLVSEATAYRYFPDLPSLISEALAGAWPEPAEALRPVADSVDPVERVAHACEFLLRGTLARQGAVRAMIAATITRPETAAARPGIRFGLIDHALAPVREAFAAADPEGLAQLERDLAVTVSAEALFCLTDLCGLAPDEAIASAVRTASTLTAAALRTAALRP